MTASWFYQRGPGGRAGPDDGLAYVWAVEEERAPDIPASVLANMTDWNVELLQRRWEKKRRERQELFGSA